jgi:hypothetical protein
MNKTSSDKKKGIKIEFIVMLIFIIIIVFAAGYLAIPYFFSEETEIRYTSTYKNVDPKTAYNIINNTDNLIIIDCRGLEGCGTCKIKREGRLDFDSVYLNDNPYVHFNTTENLLIYSINGTVAEEDFCKVLVNNVYGKIYNLDGGFEAWKALDYPITKAIPSEYPG